MQAGGVQAVLLEANSSPGPLISSVTLAPEHAARLLVDPLRLHCPLPSRLGLPLVLAPVQPGRELVPVTVGHNPRR